MNASRSVFHLNEHAPSEVNRRPFAPARHRLAHPGAVFALGIGGLALLVVFLLPMPSVAQASGAIRAVLQGTIRVNPEVDSTEDYAGFEVLVAQQAGESVDTLGYATTDRQGRFRTEVVAPERALYPLIIRRRGTTLATANYVVADGESATLNVELPQGNRLLRIRSTENSAWLAYQNTMIMHRRSLVQDLQGDSTQTGSMGQMGQSVEQTASILWHLDDSFPHTLGAAYARAEAVLLLEGWDDSLAVARAREVEPSNPRYVEVARSARRAQARRAGQQAALTLVRAFQERARSENQRAALQAEVVRAHIDSLEQDAAVAAARTLVETYPNSRWTRWADRAAYEVKNLMPGMEAPEFTVTTWTGEELSLPDLRGRPVVLEFYQPSNDLFQKQLPTRKALYEGTRAANLALVSISLQPDTLLNEAFFEGRDLPGTHVIATEEEARAFVETYNIGALPTRFLIDAEGKIVGKYVGSAFAALQEELARRIDSGPPK